MCYRYKQEHGRHRPRYKKEQLAEIQDWLTYITNDTKRLKKEFKGDSELIRLVEGMEFAQQQLSKALRERRKESK
jgi:archaellum component FlaC